MLSPNPNFVLISTPKRLSISLRVQGRSISADNLLVRIRDLLPKCFAPTNIFTKMRCTQTAIVEKNLKEHLAQHLCN